MLTISRNDIILTRGDTLTLTVSLMKDGDPYTPEEADVIRLACSKSWLGNAGYSLMFEAVIPNDTLTVTIPATATKIPEGAYNYDVEITHDDGCVDTVISGRLTITGEAK